MENKETLRIGGQLLNWEEKEVTITEIRIGSHGIAIEGGFQSGRKFAGYMIKILPPCPNPPGEQRPFYKFGGYSSITLIPSNRKVGIVSFTQRDRRKRTTEEYDRAWEESAEVVMKIIQEGKLPDGREISQDDRMDLVRKLGIIGYGG